MTQTAFPVPCQMLSSRKVGWHDFCFHTCCTGEGRPPFTAVGQGPRHAAGALQVSAPYTGSRGASCLGRHKIPKSRPP